MELEMGNVFQSKDGIVEIRPGVRIKVTTPKGSLNAVVEGIYGVNAPFEIEIIENPSDPIESPLKAGDYILLRVDE